MLRRIVFIVFYLSCA